MSKPIFLRSSMTGAPTLQAVNGNINAILNACLVNGFNTQSVSSASAASGVVTFNFASSPGFSAEDTVTIAGSTGAVADGQYRVQSAASNQVLVAIPGVPDGAVGGTITMKFSPLGWTRAYNGTNLGAYRQGGAASHKRYLRVYDGSLSVDYSWYARGYETMTAISSGTQPFPTTAMIGGNGTGFYGGQYSLPGVHAWIVVGTPRAFYLMIGMVNNDSGATATFSPSALQGFFYGELSDLQKAADVYATGIAGAASFPSGGVTLNRNFAGTSGSANNVSLYAVSGQNSFSFGVAHPDPITGNVILPGQVWAHDTTGGGGIRGALPGALCTVSSPYAASGKIPPLIESGVTGVTGRIVYIGNSNNGAAGDGVLLLDEDWGDL